MTDHQRDLLLKICEMQRYLGWFTGALLGTYHTDIEQLTIIKEQDSKLQKLVSELQDMILGEK